MNSLPEKQDMGIPAQVANPKAVFPRQFRWVAVPNNEEIQHFFTKFEPNFSHKSIEAEVMEDPLMAENGEMTGGGKVHNWIVQLQKDSLYGQRNEGVQVDFYDGCGERLYSLKFSGLALLFHEMPLDYSKSDVVKHQLTFEYLEMERLPGTSVA